MDFDYSILQSKFYPHSKTIYLPNPSWPNHAPIFRNSGLEVKSYRHYDAATCGFDAPGCYDDLKVCTKITYSSMFVMVLSFNHVTFDYRNCPKNLLCYSTLVLTTQLEWTLRLGLCYVMKFVIFSCWVQVDEWTEVSKICRERNHFIVVDMAYQGFATGDLDADSAGLKLLVRDGHELALCQSFSKNMGLYGELVFD